MGLTGSRLHRRRSLPVSREPSTSMLSQALPPACKVSFLAMRQTSPPCDDLTTEKVSERGSPSRTCTRADSTANPIVSITQVGQVCGSSLCGEERHD
eukprot:4895003-Amphidinium_carterae.1